MGARPIKLRYCIPHFWWCRQKSLIFVITGYIQYSFLPTQHPPLLTSVFPFHVYFYKHNSRIDCKIQEVRFVHFTTIALIFVFSGLEKIPSAPTKYSSQTLRQALRQNLIFLAQFREGLKKISSVT